MHKTQVKWSVISAELRLALAECGLTPTALSHKAKIDYYAARRLLSGRLEKRSANAIALCKYFGIETVQNAKTKEDQKRLQLERLISEVWDGSEPHAQLIERLIRSTKNFMIQDKP